MKRYAKPNTELLPSPDTFVQASDAFDVATELEKCEEVLRREVRNIMAESMRGKLSKASADDLIKYMKELRELQDDQKEKIKQTSTEKLKDTQGKG